MMEAWGAFFSEEPFVRTMQLTLLAGAAFLVFLVFFTTRDILHRTRSFLYQISCILLVAALPFAGFLLYLLIRPSETVKEREMREKVGQILERLEKGQTLRPHINSFPLKKSLPALRQEWKHRPIPTPIST